MAARALQNPAAQDVAQTACPSQQPRALQLWARPGERHQLSISLAMGTGLGTSVQDKEEAGMSALPS